METVKQRGFITDGWMLLIGLIVVLGMIAGIAFTVTSYLKGVEQKGYERGKAEVQLVFDKFKADTKAAGDAAEATKKLTEAKDKADKEKADATNADLRGKLAVALKRVRDNRVGASAGILPSPPASTPSAEVATFDRPKLDRALRDFTSGVEELLGEGAEAVIDLNTAKQWTQP